MRLFLIFITVCVFCPCGHAQCGSYPTDTLWQHEDGSTKDCFVVTSVLFEFDKAELVGYNSWTVQHGYRDSSFVDNMHQQLQSLASIILADSAVYEISFHTDGRGSPYYSTRLDVNRAKAIVQYLHQQHGVPLDKMIYKGFGNELPRHLENGAVLNMKYIGQLSSKQEQEIAHQLNRRLQVRRLL